MKIESNFREQALEKELAANDLLRAWRSQIREIKKIAKERMSRLHGLDRLPEAEEAMRRDVEAVTLNFYEEARRHGLPVTLVNGRLRMNEQECLSGAHNRSPESPLPADTNPQSPWVQRRLKRHLRYGFEAN